jgi:hypothetical protein
MVCICISVVSSSNATVRTVNNNNPSPGQYTSFAPAYTASLSGDTIYVSGSATSYGTFSSVAKTLTIIGTGHNPDKQNPLVSIFTYIDVVPGGGGTKFIGLLFTANGILTTSNITYESCKFDGGIGIGTNALTGFVFNKCVFAPVAVFGSFSGTTTCTFNNCVFNGSMNGGTAVMSGSATNCIFIGVTAGVGQNHNNFTFSNNIFYGTSPQITGTNTNTTMTKNLSFACPNNNFNGTTLSGNIVNSNPMFTTYPSATGFHYTDNYALLGPSPGHNYGTDGKDIGLYGGANGINFHMGGDPPIPQIRQMNVVNPVIPIGSPVNVNIISTRKN